MEEVESCSTVDQLQTPVLCGLSVGYGGGVAGRNSATLAIQLIDDSPRDVRPMKKSR